MLKFESEEELLGAARHAYGGGASSVASRLLIYPLLLDHLEACVNAKTAALPAYKKLRVATLEFRHTLHQLEAATDEKPYGQAIHRLLSNHLKAMREALDELHAAVVKENP